MKIQLLALALPLLAAAQPAPTLRSILLEQLRTTHDQKDWFVPVKIALEGLTPAQASWTDGKGNHSIGQLANHLLFWNQHALATFTGKPTPKGNVVNDETFNKFDKANWKQVTHDLDEVLSGWEKAVEAADEKALLKSASTIAHIGAHNAYHVGQIIYIRKLQGVWDANQGVK